ncbi:hypothetical protein N8303_06220 [Gammaproteobacteria bacterium]|jgi:hypothetical protein|nr:hypothetical protein [Gammaproteobacteria bacterium]
MPNRRQFLKIGLATSTIPLAASASGKGALGAFPADKTLPFYKVIVDDRFQESIEFGQAMEERGYDTYLMKDGDLTEFWYKHLNAIWEKEPVAIAGLTKFGPLFCLEQLGRTYGARQVYRGDHLYEQGKITHKLNGPEKMLENSSNFLSFSNEKMAGQTVAEMMLGCEAGTTAIVGSVCAEQVNHHSELTDALPEDNLVSWIVAPAQIS